MMGAKYDITPTGSFFLELKKARRRPVWLLIPALIIIDCAYLYSPGSSKTGTEWLSVPYYLGITNMILLSIFAAILASGVMDREHRAAMWKLLETAQSKTSLYLGKLIYGAFYIVGFAVVQLPALILWGYLRGWEGGLPARDWLLFAASEILYGMIIYTLQCAISLACKNQFAALSFNLIMTFLGFFLLFVTRRSPLPWTMLASLDFMMMDWNPAAETALFYYDFAPIWMWVVALLYLVCFIALGLWLYNRFEEESLPHFGQKIRRSTDAESKSPVEMIKLKRAPLWVAFFIMPILSAFIGTFNFMANLEILSLSWEPLWSQHSLFHGLFFMPPLIGILASHLWRLEHSGTNWNMLLPLAPPHHIVRDKLLVLALVSSLSVVWIGALYILCGKIVGITEPLPVAAFLDWTLCGIAGAIAVCAAQCLFSLIIKSFALPVGLGFSGAMSALFLRLKGFWYLSPYALFQLGLRSNNPGEPISHLPFLAACALWTAVCYTTSAVYLQRADVRTG